MLKIKSWVVLILIALLAGACATGPRQAPEPAVWHRKPVQVASLSLRQQVAQLVEHDALELRRFRIFGVDGIPHWGTPREALEAHRLDGASIAARIRGD